MNDKKTFKISAIVSALLSVASWLSAPFTTEAMIGITIAFAVFAIVFMVLSKSLD